MSSWIARLLRSLRGLPLLGRKAFWASAVAVAAGCARVAACALAALLCLFMAASCVLRGAGGGSSDSTGAIVYLTLFLCCVVGMLQFLISRRPSTAPARRQRAEMAMASAMGASLFLGAGYLCVFLFWSGEFASAPRWLQTLWDPARRCALAASMGALLIFWLRINQAARGVSGGRIAKPKAARAMALLAEALLIPGILILALALL